MSAATSLNDGMSAPLVLNDEKTLDGSVFSFIPQPRPSGRSWATAYVVLDH